MTDNKDADKDNPNRNELSGNFGIGQAYNSTFTGNPKFAGVINEAQQQSLAEAATEIQQLLKVLEKSYPADTTTEKMAIATEAIKQIESNPPLLKRVMSALKAGGAAALESLLDHPAASFLIAALEDLQKTG